MDMTDVDLNADKAQERFSSHFFECCYNSNTQRNGLKIFLALYLRLNQQRHEGLR
jgi:hypothetical protein